VTKFVSLALVVFVCDCLTIAQPYENTEVFSEVLVCLGLWCNMD